jgi:hypothetical protein
MDCEKGSLRNLKKSSNNLTWKELPNVTNGIIELSDLDEESIKDAIRHKSMFNLLDTEAGDKV